jgi:hypothetical protein
MEKSSLEFAKEEVQTAEKELAASKRFHAIAWCREHPELPENELLDYLQTYIWNEKYPAKAEIAGGFKSIKCSFHPSTSSCMLLGRAAISSSKCFVC